MSQNIPLKIKDGILILWIWFLVFYTCIINTNVSATTVAASARMLRCMELIAASSSACLESMHVYTVFHDTDSTGKWMKPCVFPREHTKKFAPVQSRDGGWVCPCSQSKAECFLYTDILGLHSFISSPLRLHVKLSFSLYLLNTEPHLHSVSLICQYTPSLLASCTFFLFLDACS